MNSFHRILSAAAGGAKPLDRRGAKYVTMERGKPPRGTAGQNFEKTECFESMVLKHHTLNPFDRKPQGAVATGGQVRLRLTVEDEQAPVELFLRDWRR